MRSSLDCIEATGQVLNFSFCVPQNIPPIWALLLDSTQITLGALMCLLVVLKFIKEAHQMYKATKHFCLNRYMNLLFREGMIYFLVYVQVLSFPPFSTSMQLSSWRIITNSILTYALINILGTTGNVPKNGWWPILIGMMEYIPPYTLVPRFILSLRKLYTSDLRGRRGSNIDTAFGLTSTSSHGAAASVIMFVDAGQNEVLDESEEIQMEEREICAAGSSSA